MKTLLIGEKLKNLRKSKNLTTSQVAEKIGISQSYISRFENNRAVPDVDMLNAILEVYNVSLSEFFDEGKDLLPELQDLLDNAKNLPLEQIDAINKLIKTITKG